LALAHEPSPVRFLITTFSADAMPNFTAVVRIFVGSLTKLYRSRYMPSSITGRFGYFSIS
jgi:hypothetical protein